MRPSLFRSRVQKLAGMAWFLVDGSWTMLVKYLTAMLKDDIEVGWNVSQVELLLMQVGRSQTWH